jgi:nucleoside-diphosphate-sugar epimerase
MERFITEAEFVNGSYGNRDLLKKSLDGVDLVIHNAAFLGVKRTTENPWRVLEINNYLNHIFFNEISISKVKKLIFASSSEVYGEPLQIPEIEKQPLRCETPYQICKRLSETYCQVLYEQYGIDTCSFRYFNVYGPRQNSTPYGFVIAIFLARAMNSEPLIIYGDGTQTRDFTYISDIVDANILAISKETQGATFNIGTGKEISINKLADTVTKLTSKHLDIIHVDPIENDIRRRCADITKARKYLGFTPKIALGKGLRKTQEWLNG